MNISRRDFLKYCGVSAAVLGLSGVDLFRLEQALAAPDAPAVLWLQGASCTGCSMSLMNRISTGSPTTVADLLVNNINLVYHPNLMALAGDDAAAAAYATYDQAVANRRDFVLVVEGGVPTHYAGRTCFAWTRNGTEETFQTVIQKFAPEALRIICVGTCAAYGGIPASAGNPYEVLSVRAATNLSTINIAGCPPHPDWIVWPIVQLLLGNPISLDSYGRPTAIFHEDIHDDCPREEQAQVGTFGANGCLMRLGCRGPGTHANCPGVLWNNRQSWCIGDNAPCYGCTEPGFPGVDSFYKQIYFDDDD